MRTVSINPPPKDLKCEVCRRRNETLQKTYRTMFVIPESNVELKNKVEELESIWKKELDNLLSKEETDEALNKFALKVGSKEYEGLLLISQLKDTIEASWECNNCLQLSDGERLKVREK